MPELPPLPGREEYWNIGYPLLGTLVYITIGIAAVALVYGFYQRYKILSLGKSTPDLGGWDARIARGLKLASVMRPRHCRSTRFKVEGPKNFTIYKILQVATPARLVTRVTKRLYETRAPLPRFISYADGPRRCTTP